MLLVELGEERCDTWDRKHADEAKRRCMEHETCGCNPEACEGIPLPCNQPNILNKTYLEGEAEAALS